ncbi:MAG: LacI family DNA-binding transcriptional regulator, partial [Rhodococcus sp. (in: high G+C Gram-positive bacteria)]
MDARRPTSKQVAALAGMSQTAVSFVLNGRDGGNVSGDARRRILAAADELGYRPDRIARSMRSNTTTTLGLMTDRIATSPFAGAIVRGAMDRAWTDEHMLLVIDTASGDGDSPTDVAARRRAAVNELIDRRVDGIIYATMGLTDVEPLQDLRETPVVQVNCLSDDPRQIAIVPNDALGGEVAARALIDAGHREIAVITGPPDHPATVQRLIGTRRAFATHDIPLESNRLIYAGGEIDHGLAGARTLLASPGPPTAVICFNDRVALGVLLAASQLGVRIPQDLSVIGYDDQEHLAALTDPALSTV